MSGAKGTDDFRADILQYLAQEINAHASMIVGFAVVLFAYLDIAVRQFFEPPIEAQIMMPKNFQAAFSGLAFYIQAELQYILVFIVLVVIVWALIFSLFRLGFYGLLTRKTLEYNETSSQFTVVWNKLISNIGEAKVFGLPAKWFVDGFAKPSKGFWASLVLSLIVCLILAVTLFLKFV